ncbi:thiopeptide-type bacteriocin biosynthesis protein [Arthrobacter sp. GCM10027362]|uniref:thiopeptide-type bacteriocin biosynthesis protein n=1 Tax=Arthrobacter sp. GCM10027362 TaxID=3273379 RepID=UPI00363E0B33
MSQLTAVRTSESLGLEPYWWVLSIYTGRQDEAEAVIGELVTPLVAHARREGVGRWYFSQHADRVGHHVKVRFLGSRPMLDSLRRFEMAARNRARCLATVRTEQHYVLPAQYEESYSLLAAGMELQEVQESELDRFGGPEGLELAEEVFELSSELAMWATQRFSKRQGRSALAALLLSDAAWAMFHGARAAQWPDRTRLSWDYYWNNHLRASTAELGREAAKARAGLEVGLMSRTKPMHRLMAATAAESSVQNWRRRWTRAIDTYLYRADKARASRSAHHLTFSQAHLMVNRLGFTSWEEASLGIYARGWTPDVESFLLEKREI